MSQTDSKFEFKQRRYQRIKPTLLLKQNLGCMLIEACAGACIACHAGGEPHQCGPTHAWLRATLARVWLHPHRACIMGCTRLRHVARQFHPPLPQRALIQTRVHVHRVCASCPCKRVWPVHICRSVTCVVDIKIIFFFHNLNGIYVINSKTQN